MVTSVVASSETKTINSANYSSSYSYDRQGNITLLTYPDTTEIKYEYNSAGLLEKVQKKEPSAGTYSDLVEDYDYSPLEQITYQKFYNGAAMTNTYDADNLYRLTNKTTIINPVGDMMLGAMLKAALYSEAGAAETAKPIEEFTKDELLLAGMAKENEDGSVTLNDPQELKSKRDKNSASYLTGFTNDGKKIIKGIFYGGEVNYFDKEKGGYEPIDTSLVENTDYWSMDKASYQTRIKKNLGNDFATFINQGTEISFSIPDKETANILALKTSDGDLSNKQVIYQNALGKDIDLLVSLNNEALIKEVKINNLEALGDLTGKEYYEIPFKLSSNKNIDIISNGKKLSEEGEIVSKEGVEIISEDGIKSYIWTPYAKDSSEIINSINIDIAYQLKEDGIYMIKRLPAEWLKNAKYPVTTDATVSYFSGAGDGRISYSTLSSWSDCRNASSGSYSSPTVTEDYSAGSSRESAYFSIWRGFFPVDTSGLPDNATVTAAQMKIYLQYVYDNDNDGKDYVALVQTSQSSGTTFSNDDYDLFGTTEGTNQTDLTGLSTGEYKSFTLNSTGLEWINKTGYTKLGMREGHDIQDEAPDATKFTYFYSFYSEETGTNKDPYIEIIYTENSNNPTAPTGLETEGQTNPEEVNDPSPEFSAIFNDPDSGDLTSYYRLQVATSTEFTSFLWDSAKTSLASTTPVGYRTELITYAGDALTSSSTYYWRIKFWDNVDHEGAWSTATSSFTYVNDRIQDISYTYDKVGNITKIIDDSSTNAKRTMDFTYDDLHRLTIASSTLAATTDYRQTYSFNAIGNITNKSDLGDYTYTDNGYNNPHAAVSINGTTNTYDNNGNLLNDGTWSHAWDYDNRIASSTNGTITVNYAYDHEGQRVRQSNGTDDWIYVNRYYDVNHATTTKHIFAGDQLIATIEGNGVATSTYYVHTDHLGGSSVLTDESGDVVQLLDYYPFGGTRIDEKTGSYDNRKKFTGKELDDETGLYYFGSRYQNPNIGKFVSQDPASRDNSEQFLEDPQQFNYYSYARNNPIKYTDPTGECIWDACAIETLAVISVTDLVLASLAGTAAVVATNQAIQRSNWVEPTLISTEPASDTNFNPNGPPPKGSPKWKKAGAIIGGVLLGIASVIEPLKKYDEEVNQEPVNPNKKGETKPNEKNENNNKNKKENKPPAAPTKPNNPKTNYPAVKYPYQNDSSKKPNNNSNNNNCPANKKDKH